MKLKAYLDAESKKPGGGMSLRALARKARVNESTVWRAKVGKPVSMKSAARISAATNVKGRPVVRLEDLLQKEMDL